MKSTVSFNIAIAPPSWSLTMTPIPILFPLPSTVASQLDLRTPIGGGFQQEVSVLLDKGLVVALCDSTELKVSSWSLAVWMMAFKLVNLPQKIIAFLRCQICLATRIASCTSSRSHLSNKYSIVLKKSGKNCELFWSLTKQLAHTSWASV